LLIEALVDHRKRFLDLEIGWPGSVGDCRIFESSDLNGKYEEELTRLGTTALTTGEDIDEEIPAFILGDSAYRNSRHMVTTYKVTECKADASVRHLNFQLSKARYKVEHAFGLLKGRFHVFEKPLRSAGEDLSFSVRLISRVGAGRFGRAAGQSDRVFGPHEWTSIRARPKKSGKDRTDRNIFGLELAWDHPNPSVFGPTDRTRPRARNYHQMA
jgi:hypothetical protein